MIEAAVSRDWVESRRDLIQEIGIGKDSEKKNHVGMGGGGSSPVRSASSGGLEAEISTSLRIEGKVNQSPVALEMTSHKNGGEEMLSRQLTSHRHTHLPADGLQHRSDVQ